MRCPVRVTVSVCAGELTRRTLDDLSSSGRHRHHIVVLRTTPPPRAVPRQRGAASSPLRGALRAPLATTGPAASVAGGLEQFDDVAGRVFQQDLLATRTDDDVVSEREPFGAQPVHLGSDVAD